MKVKFPKKKGITVDGQAQDKEGVEGNVLLCVYFQHLLEGTGKVSERLIAMSCGKVQKGKERRRGFSDKARTQKRNMTAHFSKVMVGFLRVAASSSAVVGLCSAIASTMVEISDSRRTAKVTSLDESIGSSQSEEESFSQSRGFFERQVSDQQDVVRRWMESIAQTVQ